jgi:hypothetical protein
MDSVLANEGELYFERAGQCSDECNGSPCAWA